MKHYVPYAALLILNIVAIISLYNYARHQPGSAGLGIAFMMLGLILSSMLSLIVLSIGYSKTIRKYPGNIAIAFIIVVLNLWELSLLL